MKTTMLLAISFLPGILSSQIQEKIHYKNTPTVFRSKGSAAMAVFFFRDYDLENDIKVRGLDDSLMADNIVKVEHTSADVSFYDVTGLKIKDSTLVTFYGTFYIRNYDLSPQEQTKKFISRKGADNVIRVARVLTDSAGRPFFKEWTRGWIDFPVAMITSVHVSNSNFWVNSQQEKGELIRRIYNRVRACYFTGGVVTMAGLILLLSAG